MLGRGGPDYGAARDALYVQYGAEESLEAVTEALQLLHAVQSGLAGVNGADRTDDVGDVGTDGGAGTDAGDAGAERPVESSRSAEVMAALVVLRHLRAELASWEPQLIAAARAAGASWASLATALGVTSRQAAERRYLRLQPSVTGEPTGEGRVQAERTKRAGDRAVAQWARQNSASLRQLAGQISAVAGLATAARRQADLVQQALADDDPATLLPPLAEARAHLGTSHAVLAAQIDSIIEQADRLRRDTHDRRNQLRDQDRSGRSADH